MSLKNETAVFRICGNCTYAGRRLENVEIQKLKRRAHFEGQYVPLVLLRRYSRYLRNAKSLCRREKMNVSLLEEACAFWKPHRKPRI